MIRSVKRVSSQHLGSTEYVKILISTKCGNCGVSKYDKPTTVMTKRRIVFKCIDCQNLIGMLKL